MDTAQSPTVASLDIAVPKGAVVTGAPQHLPSISVPLVAAFESVLPMRDQRFLLREAPDETRRLLVFGPRLLPFTHRSIFSIRHPRQSFNVWSPSVSLRTSLRGVAPSIASHSDQLLAAMETTHTAMVDENVRVWSRLAAAADELLLSCPAADAALEQIRAHPGLRKTLEIMWDKLAIPMPPPTNGRRGASAAAATSALHLSLSESDYVDFELRLYIELYHPKCLLGAVDAIYADFLVDRTDTMEGEGGNRRDAEDGLTGTNDTDDTDAGRDGGGNGSGADSSADARATDGGSHGVVRAKGGVRFSKFCDSMLELADNWTASTAVEEYVAFLADLNVRLFAADWSADADAFFQLILSQGARQTDALQTLMQQQMDIAKQASGSHQRVLTIDDMEKLIANPDVAKPWEVPLEDTVADVAADQALLKQLTVMFDEKTALKTVRLQKHLRQKNRRKMRNRRWVVALPTQYGTLAPDPAAAAVAATRRDGRHDARGEDVVRPVPPSADAKRPMPPQRPPSVQHRPSAVLQSPNDALLSTASSDAMCSTAAISNRGQPGAQGASTLLASSAAMQSPAGEADRTRELPPWHAPVPAAADAGATSANESSLPRSSKSASRSDVAKSNATGTSSQSTSSPLAASRLDGALAAASTMERFLAKHITEEQLKGAVRPALPRPATIKDPQGPMGPGGPHPTTARKNDHSWPSPAPSCSRNGVRQRSQPPPRAGICIPPSDFSAICYTTAAAENKTSPSATPYTPRLPPRLRSATASRR